MADADPTPDRTANRITGRSVPDDAHPPDPATVPVPVEGLPADPAEQPLHDRLCADPRVDTVLIPRSHLKRRVATLARDILRETPPGQPLTLVIVLKGAATFGTDLGEALCEAGAADVRYEFLRASTYGDGIKGAGESGRAVRLTLPPGDLTGADVVLVDDLVDQAFTLTHLARHLREQAGVARLRLCVLAEKVLADPSPEVARLRAALQPDYVGFRVPDRWVAGYGIDAGEDFRHLPCLITVREEHYRP